MLLLIAFYLEEGRAREKKMQKKTQKDARERMTIILLKAYKQHPCASLHMQLQSSEEERHRLEQWI